MCSAAPPAPDAPDRLTQLGQLADLIVRVARRIEAHRFQDPGITPLGAVESMLLRYVDDHPGTSRTQVAADLVMQGSNASAGLRSLEAKGLVTRTADPHDGRVAHLNLTDEARQIAARVRAEWGSLLETLLPESTDVTAAVALLAALDTPQDQQPRTNPAGS